MNAAFNQAQAEIEQSRERTRNTAANVVQLLSLQPPTSIAHQVEAYGDGLRIPFRPYASATTYYVYALPWSRGWSVFVSSDPRAGAYSWRQAPTRFKGLQVPIYTPRDTAGAWRVDPAVILGALLYIIERLQKYDRARRANPRTGKTRKAVSIL